MIDNRFIEDYHVISLDGKISSSEAFELSKVFEALLKSETVHIILDLNHISMINTKAVKTIQKYCFELKKEKKNLLLTKGSRFVMSTLDLAGLVGKCNIFDSLSEAKDFLMFGNEKNNPEINE